MTRQFLGAPSDSTPMQLTARPRRAVLYGAMALYCCAIWLALDFAYSMLFHERIPSGRVAHPYYHHGWAANYAGFESWGPLQAPMYTNSLGFKDSHVRDVPVRADTGRRIVLIGDSFAEGIGLKFEDSFAGLLYQAGQQRRERIEFLNAGAVSYSPVIYYKKIKYLLEAGLQFDEVVLFSDISDVQDEATGYFCIDDNPIYQAHCKQPSPPTTPPSLGVDAIGRPPLPRRSQFKDFFAVTAQGVQLLKTKFGMQSRRQFLTADYRRAIWTIPGSAVGHTYDPLGIEGGIERSLANVQALADLLRARGISLSIAVYPWPLQLAQDDRDSRQVQIWRDFCAKNCKTFINVFPAMFAVKDARNDWLEYLFIPGDLHYGPEGNKIMYDVVREHLLGRR
jgi:hypothetical protein